MACTISEQEVNMQGHQPQRGRNGRQRPFDEQSAGGRSERHAQQRDQEQFRAGYRASDWERDPSRYRNTRSEPHWDPDTSERERHWNTERTYPEGSHFTAPHAGVPRDERWRGERDEQWRADDPYSAPMRYERSRFQGDTRRFEEPQRYEPGGFPQGLRPAGSRDWDSRRDWESERELRETHHHSELGQRLEDAGRRLIGKVKGLVRSPKNYKRSDERIREDICDRLSVSPDVDPSELEVSVSAGEVTLTGIVPDRQMKFIAEDIADDVPGVHEIHNQLRVRRAAPANSNAATTQHEAPASQTRNIGRS
jgi:hypothetical protein